MEEEVVSAIEELRGKTSVLQIVAMDGRMWRARIKLVTLEGEEWLVILTRRGYRLAVAGAAAAEEDEWGKEDGEWSESLHELLMKISVGYVKKFEEELRLKLEALAALQQREDDDD